MFRSSVRPNEDEGRICFIRLTVLSQLSQFGSILMHMIHAKLVLVGNTLQIDLIVMDVRGQF